MPGLARRVRVVFDWTVDLLFPASALQLGLASRGRCIEARPLGAVERLAIELPCMNNPEDEPAPAEETDADRRRGILADKGLSLDLVSALAGDRPLTEAEENHLGDLERDRGPRFFSDVFYAITHHFFPPEIAKDLWTEVVRHKVVLSETLGRNVRIAVAALDYLSNITDNLGSTTLVSEAFVEEVVGQSLRDGLTGLFNHTFFCQQIDLEVRRYARYGAVVSLVLVDIDDFKAINDTYGHMEGDRILAAMGRSFIRLARDSDICCRYGGEEFAVILPLTDVREAGSIADRLRMELGMVLPGRGTLTVSIGVASSGKNTETDRDLVEEADMALYRAKKRGKNRIVVAADQEAGSEE
jgi:diguanylate cyclase (GGDEF)-like protein